jgi:hypothetical protein
MVPNHQAGIGVKVCPSNHFAQNPWLKKKQSPHAMSRMLMLKSPRLLIVTIHPKNKDYKSSSLKTTTYPN